LDFKSYRDEAHGAENGKELAYFMTFKEISGRYVV